MRKKIIAVLLACMMAASVVPMSVSANGGEGTDPTTGVSTLSEVLVENEENLKSAISNATAGTVIKLSQDITLTSTLTIDKKITIDGDSKYKLVSGFTSLPDQDYEQNLVTFSTGSAGSVLKDIEIKTNEYNRNAVNTWRTGGTVTLENVTIDHTSSNSNGGAPLIVGSSSVKVVGNLTLTTGKNSWYGINIDNTYAGAALDFSECTSGNLFGSFADKMAIKSDIASASNPVSVTGASNVGIEAGFSATVSDETMGVYFTSFDDAVKALNQYSAAISSVVNIDLYDNVVVNAQAVFKNQVNFNGHGYSVTAGFGSWVDDSTRNLISFEPGSDGSVIEDITFNANANTRNVLNIWKAGNIDVKNVTLDHTNAMKGAPLVVTSSNVTVNGNLEMITGPNSWYAFNVDSEKYNADAKVTFSESSTVTYTDNSNKNLPLAGLDLKDDQMADSAVADPANKVLAARFVAANGQVQLFDNLQDAVTAAEASGSEVTITVLRSDEEATVNPQSNVKFNIEKVEDNPPVLKDQNGTKYEVSADGTLAEVEDPGTDEPGTEEPVVEKYTAIINGTPYEYKEGDTVSLYTPLYTYDGRRFVYWVGNVEFDNAYSPSTSFTMPAGDVEVKAVYTYISYTPVEPDVPDYTPVKPVEPDEPEIEWIQKDGNTYLYIDDEMITGWHENEDGWYWFDEETGVMSDDCWEKIDGVWYLFDEDGVMLTDWQKVDGKWYYLKPWGGMATGWQLIDSVWYYLRGDGSMAANAWVQSGGYWYYLTGSGEMATNKWVEWKGDWYYLYSSGIMATNATIDGYYVDSNGIWQA